VGIIIYTILHIIESRMIPKHYGQKNYLYSIINFFIALTLIWISLLIATSSSIISNIIGIPSYHFLIHEAFPNSLFGFFIRLGYALAPWKMFWLDEFTNIGLNYGSPVFVPSLLIFTLPFFYASVFLIPLFYRRNANIIKAYSLTLALMLFGLIQPIFNTTNPDYGFEPSEGIFALPFYCYFIAFSLYIFLNWIYKSLKSQQNKSSPSKLQNQALNIKKFNTKLFSVILIAVLIIFASINIVSFTNELFVSSVAHYEDDNASLNYMFYGWDQVTNYLLDKNLLNVTLYYTPGKEGNHNLTNIENLNYWFYHQNFPLYWLYTFSNGKIRKINLLYPGSVPPLPKNSAIVLSQNASYPKLLKSNGYNFEVVYTVYRANGEPAIQVIEIRNTINSTEISQMVKSNIFYAGNISSPTSYIIPSLSNITTQFTVSVNFTYTENMTKPNTIYSIIKTYSPAFSLGMWSMSFISKGAPNSTYVPQGTIYTNIGNWSLLGSWIRLSGYQPLLPNVSYVLTLTFNNKDMSANFISLTYHSTTFQLIFLFLDRQLYLKNLMNTSLP
ncbi:MAG: hypothetical protein ACP5IB_09240, partial [Thermoplasmata archaeon]